MNLELERGALSALISVAHENITAAQGILAEAGTQAGDFEEADFGSIFGAVSAIVLAGGPLELHALGKALPQHFGKTVGGLWGKVETAGDALSRLSLVRDAGWIRRYQTSLGQLLAMSTRHGMTRGEIAAETQKVAEAVVASSATAGDLDQDLFGFVDDLERIASQRMEPVIPSGIQPLDVIIGGLQRTLTIVGALPGVGKSALLATIANNLARSGRRVGFFSLEDERRWLTTRIVSSAAGVPVFVLQNRPLNPGQQSRVDRAFNETIEPLKRIRVDDKPLSTVADVVNSAREMVTRRKVEVLIIDHLGEIKIDRTDRHDLDVIETLQQLRALSKAYRIPVIVAAHLKRRQGLDANTAPELTDFAFSSGLERMARVALGLHAAPNGDMVITVLKQTNGPPGSQIPVRFEKASGMLINAPTGRAAEMMKANVEAMATEESNMENA